MTEIVLKSGIVVYSSMPAGEVRSYLQAGNKSGAIPAFLDSGLTKPVYISAYAVEFINTSGAPYTNSGTALGSVDVTSLPALPAGANSIGSVKSTPDAPVSVSGTASALNADVIPSTDVSQASAVLIQILGTWAGTISFQASNDNATWVPVAASIIGNTSSASATTTTGNNLLMCAAGYKYFRARMTSYTSGTAQGIMLGSRTPQPVFSLAGAMYVQARSSGGANTSRRVSTADTNLATIKSAAATLYNVVGFNTAASTRFVKLFNKTSNPVLGTDTPVMTLMIPANSPINISLAADIGSAFATGLSIAITGGSAYNDTTAIGAGEVEVAFVYN